MKVNKPLLESKMKLFGDNQSDLATYLGISLSRLNAKINGKADFTKAEMEKIKFRYNLNLVEFDMCFFSGGDVNGQ